MKHNLKVIATMMAVSVIWTSIFFAILGAAGCKRYKVTTKSEVVGSTHHDVSGRVDVVQSGSSVTVMEYKINFDICTEIKASLLRAGRPENEAATAESNCLTALVALLEQSSVPSLPGVEL